MNEKPKIIPGCLLRKFSPERVIQGVRLEDYCKDDCRVCGFNNMEEARRKQMLRLGALERGRDGLKRLYLGPKILREPSDDKEAET